MCLSVQSENMEAKTRVILANTLKQGRLRLKIVEDSQIALSLKKRPQVYLF